MSIDSDQLAIMTAMLSSKMNFHKAKLAKYAKVAKRISMLNQPEPLDPFDEKYSITDLEKFYVKAKAEYEKVIPPTTKS